MTRPWQTLDTVDTDEGPLALLQRGDRELLITIDGRVLMNSTANRSEIALAELSCGLLSQKSAPRILIGGLGLGLTLRAALDALPPGAQVTVAELNQTVVDWCRGPVAALHGHALEDPRVQIVVADVAGIIAAASPPATPYDGILLDLYEGPHQATQRANDPFYGLAALKRTLRALAPGGLFAVWSEEPDQAFEKRLIKAGFIFEKRRPGKGGRRHTVYLARCVSEPGLGSRRSGGRR